jgi:hypothetical protein
MTYSPASLGGTVLALLLAGGAARADFISWSYNWSRSPGVIASDNHPATGYITLTDESLKNAVGDSNIVATNLRTYSTATAADPDRFTAKVYTLTLFLLDQDSGRSTTLRFTGQFDGTLTSASANIQNTFLGPTTQTVVLGDHLYTVTLDHYSPPGPTGAVNSGSISAHATITVATVFQQPEPGTLVLACLGAGLLALAGRRGRRAALLLRTLQS